jgi:hypothetical protein
LIENFENIEEIFKDPLSQETRRTRKLLLATSFIGILIFYTGFLPEKIENLGIQFSKVEQHVVSKIMGYVIIYFLFSFVVYALSDFLSLQTRLLKNQKKNFDNIIKKFDEEKKSWSTEMLDNMNNQIFRYPSYAMPIFFIRGFIEFIFPLLLGLYSTYLLLFLFI